MEAGVSGLEEQIRAIVDQRLAELGVGSGDRLITVAAAAALVSVEPETIRAWIASGRLTAAGRAGNRLRLRAADVLAAVANGNRAPRQRRATPEERAERDVRLLRGRRPAARRG
jgi:excisionase family DNA binding protein